MKNAAAATSRLLTRPSDDSGAWVGGDASNDGITWVGGDAGSDGVTGGWCGEQRRHRWMVQGAAPVETVVQVGGVQVVGAGLILRFSPLIIKYTT